MGEHRIPGASMGARGIEYTRIQHIGRRYATLYIPAFKKLTKMRDGRVYVGAADGSFRRVRMGRGDK